MQKDVAAFLGVSTRAVGNWVAAYRADGDAGLAGTPHPGAKPKLSRRQERSALSWLSKSPEAFGYKSDLWTTRRLAEVIEKRFGIRFNSNYLAAWLTALGYSPQKPESLALERSGTTRRSPGRIAEEWPRLKKKPTTRGRTPS